MSFKELYQSKKMDADRALNLIRSGDRVVVGHACAEPSYLLDVLTEKQNSMRMLRSFIWWRWEKPDTAPRHGKSISGTIRCPWAVRPEKPLQKEEVTSHPLLFLKFQSFLKTAASRGRSINPDGSSR